MADEQSGDHDFSQNYLAEPDKSLSFPPLKTLSIFSFFSFSRIIYSALFLSSLEIIFYPRQKEIGVSGISFFFQIQIFGYTILGYLYLYLLEVRHCVDFLLEFQWVPFVIVNSSPYALLFGISKFAMFFYLFLRILCTQFYNFRIFG